MGCGGSTSARAGGGRGGGRAVPPASGIPPAGRGRRARADDYDGIVPEQKRGAKRGGDGPKKKGKRPGAKKAGGKRGKKLAAPAPKKEEKEEKKNDMKGIVVVDGGSVGSDRIAPSTPQVRGGDDPVPVTLDVNGKEGDGASSKGSAKGSKVGARGLSVQGKPKTKKKKEPEAGLTGQKLLKVEEWMEEILWENLMDPDEQVQQEQQEEGVMKKAESRSFNNPSSPEGRGGKRQSLCGAALKNFAGPVDGADTASAANTSLRLRQTNSDLHDGASTVSLTPSAVDAAQQLAQSRGPRRSQVDIDKIL
eukprot:Hpha_TRINITY_DN16866_c3_g1::TRINITY_DN16866_c3_g1_i1::g.150404::m.150404